MLDPSPRQEVDEFTQQIRANEDDRLPKIANTRLLDESGIAVLSPLGLSGVAIHESLGRWATARSVLFTSQVTMKPDSRPLVLPSRTHLIVDLRTIILAFFRIDVRKGSGSIFFRAGGMTESENRPRSG